MRRRTPRRRARVLLVWLPAVNPYWARRLTELSGSTDLEVVCWFTRSRGSNRDWITPPNHIPPGSKFLPGNPVLRMWFIFREYRKVRPSNILTFHFDPLHWLLLPTRVFGRHTAFYVEKTFDSWVTRSRAKELVKHLIFRTTNTVFVPGDDAAAYVRRYAPRARIRALNHAVDLDFLHRAADIRSKPSHIRFLYLGRIVEEKGIRTMMTAFTDAAAQQSMSFSIVGSGALEEVVRAWADDRPGDVQVSPFMQAEELLPVFAGADVLVFPTTGDPYGLVVNEAMATGMPVISSDAAGEIDARLVAGPYQQRGLIFESGDTNALTQCLVTLASDPEKVQTLSAASLKYATDTFALSSWVSSIEQWVCSG